MKKMKKLLSVLLAMIMMLSCFSILGHAYSSPDNPGEWYYDSNDNPRAYLYTDEQRASAMTDMVDGLLKGANIKMDVKILFITLKIDLTSLNATADTIGDLKGALDLAGGMLGMLGDLNYDSIDSSIETTDEGGAVKMLNMLLDFIEDNANVLATQLIEKGEIDLGDLINLGDMSAVEDFLKGLHKMVGGLVYGFGNRQMTNGIGEDPLWPNSTAWADLEDKDLPTLDAMLDNLIDKLLFQPNNTIKITERDQNTLGAYALEEVAEDGTTYYYCYGVETAEDGTQTLITTYEGDEEPYRHYLTRWDENSALLKGASAEQLKAALDLRGKTLYDLLEDVIPWAYDSLGGHNLDGQLRATLMQFCGAFNEGVTDETIQEQLKAIVNGYKEMEDSETNNGAKKLLRDTFRATDGAAGNYNFMYIALAEDGTVDTEANINDKPDNLYYVVEWGNSWQFYHVVFGENMSNFFDLIDWEYQAPMWAEIEAVIGREADTSILKHINDIVGTILGTALVDFKWTAGTADGTLAANVTELVKLVIKTDTRKLFGSTYELPADFDNFGLEGVLVELARIITPKIMPALVLPDDVASIEEVLVYALRELMADMLPHTGADTDGSSWDSVIAAATTEDQFLDIALSMGMSVGVHYLNNLIGLGTTGGDTSNNTAVATVLDLDATFDWRTKLNYVIDWVRDAYLDRLDDNVVAKYPDAMNGSDPLLKLSAIFSALMPSFVKILGADDDTYAINLNTVYNDLRKALNGDFSGLANGLMRDGIAKDASGNKSAIQAIGTLIVELFGGLGLEKASTWSNLKGMFTTAMADTVTPLTTLLGSDWNSNAKIADLAEYLLKGLAEQRAIWLQNGLTILMSLLMGFENEQSYTLSDFGVETAYTGAATAQVEYDFTLDVKGVASYFNNGRYKTGTGHKDGLYSATVVNAKAFNSKGVQVGSTVAINKVVGGNETISVTVPVPAPTVPEVYTLVTYVRVKLPSQDSDANNETIEFKRQFIITSQQNDSLTPTTYTYDNTTYWESNASYGVGTNKSNSNSHIDVHTKWTVTSTYINEKEALSKAETVMLNFASNNVEKLTNADPKHSYTKMYIPDFGYMVTKDNGDISVVTEENGSTLVDLTSKTPITLNGTSLSNTEIQNLWFKWNLNNVQPQTGYTAGSWATAAPAQMWAVESSEARSDYADDFYTYAVNAKTVIEANMNAVSGSTILSQNEKSYNQSAPFTSYVVLYNSYGLEAILDSALGYEEDDIDTSTAEGAAAWAAYQSALSNAMSQLYGQWVAAQFAANHKTTSAYDYTDKEGNAATLPAGSSTFQLAGIMLEEAVAGLADYVVSGDEEEEEVVALYDPSNPADPYHPIYLLLEEQNEKNLHDDDWVLYRWFEYNDDYQIVNTAINNLTAPSQTAPNTLWGVESDNDQIAKVIAAIGNDALEAIVMGMVEDPTEEAQKAAADAYQFFMDNIEYHLGANPVEALLARAEQMIIDGTPYAGNPATGRLLPVYDSNVYYWLEKAIADYGNVKASDGYSEKSYAEYADALADAKAVLADAKANKSTQYDIFSARYNFLVAYKALILASEEVDVTTNGVSGTEEDGLKALYAQAVALLDAISDDEVAATVDMNDDGVIDEEDDALAYEQLAWATGIKVESTNAWDEETTYYVGGEYTAAYALSLEGKRLAIKEQGWFNEITTNLDVALANFEEQAALEPNTLALNENAPFEAIVDFDNNIEGEFTGTVYGFDTLGWNDAFEVDGAIADFLTTAYGDDYLEVIEADGGETTGTIINVLDENGDAVESYVYIYFGDVNGDGLVDNGDSVYMDTYGLMFEGIDDLIQMMAADISGDGMVDNADSVYSNTYGLMFEGMPTQYEIAEMAVGNYYEFW